MLETFLTEGGADTLQSVADNLLAEMVRAKGTARCMTGLVRSLSGRPFYHDLVFCCKSWLGDPTHKLLR